MFHIAPTTFHGDQQWHCHQDETDRCPKAHHAAWPERNGYAQRDFNR